jgi:hypothetical protein
MKSLNTKSFFAGIVFSLILFISFSFYTSADDQDSNSSVPGITSITNVTPEQAMAYRNNYTAQNPNGLTAINISVPQLEAINNTVSSINGNLTAVSGFRMYFGNTSSRGDGQIVAIPYLIDSELNEMAPTGNLQMAQNFPAVYNSQCPPFCD